ncbi:MAG: hypothetical protein IJI98_08355, partial [Methanosphaera sp.]|nr:hypothetical protein [Methanosphaera sp.]
NKKKTICVYLVAILSTLLYLLINNSFWEFMNYCFFGLFDFSNNGNDSTLWVVIVELFVFIYLIYTYIKTRDRIAMYVLLFQIVMIPIFEIIHLFLAFMPVLFYFFVNTKNRIIKYIFEVFIIFFLVGFYLKIIPGYMRDINNRCMDSSSFLYEKRLPIYTDYKFDMVKEYLDKYSNYRLYFFSSNAYIYKLEYDIPVNKYDLINDGNMGYDGDNRYVSEVKEYCSSNKCLIIVRSDEVIKDFNQTSRVITQYVINNYLSIYSSNDLTFYIN